MNTAKNAHRNITAFNQITGEKIRLSVYAPMVDDYGRQISTAEERGISVTAVYMGRRWLVVEYYSIWERGHSGACIGTYYGALDMTDRRAWNEILGLCDRLDIEPPSSISVEDA